MVISRKMFAWNNPVDLRLLRLLIYSVSYTRPYVGLNKLLEVGLISYMEHF